MNVLLVYAHNEPTSFTASMYNSTLSTLQNAGHEVATTDLYGLGFNPVAEKYDFTTLSLDHYNYSNEQLHASKHDWAYSVDIVSELQKVQAADMVLFFFPLWWHAPPAILKGWLDRVLTHGTAWDEQHIYSTGKHRGKMAGIAVGVGDPEQYYGPNGVHKATVMQMLYPLLHGTLAYCGFNVLTPFIAYGLSAANAASAELQLKAYQQSLEQSLTHPQFLFGF